MEAVRREPAWVLVLGVIGLALILECLPAEVRLGLRYERSGLQAGEIWRLLTGHLIHLGPVHAVWNGAALFLLQVLFAGTLRLKDWVCVGLLSALSIDLGLYYLQPDVDWYVGLSGCLHGVAIAGALALSLQRSYTGMLLTAAIVAKLALEQWFGALPYLASGIGGAVVVDAHLYGSVGGAVGFVGLRMVPRAWHRSL
jgi:rhomboid family GlyGly-CTERM serine protease